MKTMRPLYLIIFASLLFSCKDKKNVGNPEMPKADFYRLDTMEKAEKLFYPVFELSPKTTAFVVDFSENGNKGLLDSIFDQIIHMDSSTATGFMPDCKIYDTSGPYKLIRSEKLESEIRKHYDKEFYVYGTKGNTKAAIKAIVFGLDECRTNIVAFCLDDPGPASVGHPLFCSDKKIDLSYSDKYDNIERSIGSYLSKMPSDYNDSIKLKVMGNAGNFYFTYNDDFLWGRMKDSKCRFPARGIYKIDDNNNVSRYWAEDLDLFGIPCD